MLARRLAARSLAARSLGAVVLLALAAACSSDDDDAGAPATTAQEGTTTTAAEPTTSTPTTTETDRPEGPAADVGEELSGGNGVNVASSAPPDAVLAEAGYEQHEFVAAGVATSYAAVGELTADGLWTFEPDSTAPYRTRIVVRRPAAPDAFSGTVVVEWLNVSGGLDADPDWQMLREEITRRGHIWVGVSAQLIGVNGGPVAVGTPESEAAGAGRGLRNLDPDRYGSLDHPGDGFSFDIYTQVARALRAGGDVLGGATPEIVLAAGESQSAFALVTYINGVQPLTEAFDGFFVHSRGGTALPLSPPGQPVGIADAIGGSPTILRTDGAAPILELQSESDVTGVLGSAASRQDDTDTFRLWEMAGTAHADRRLVGDRADDLGCGAINDGPMHFIAKAALAALDTWVRTGTAPPVAARLELNDDGTQSRDGFDIAIGGIRTPMVDVPVDTLTGAPGPSGSVVCILSGQTLPLTPDMIARLYDDRADYEARYEAATDAVIEAGFVLADDRDAVLAHADPSRVPA